MPVEPNNRAKNRSRPVDSMPERRTSSDAERHTSGRLGTDRLLVVVVIFGDEELGVDPVLESELNVLASQHMNC